MVEPSGRRGDGEGEGLFDSLYTNRSARYWHTPKAGGTTDMDEANEFLKGFWPRFNAAFDAAGQATASPGPLCAGRVVVHEYEDGAMAIFHGPRSLRCYDAKGRLLD